MNGLEKKLIDLQLQIHAIRALAHAKGEESLAKLADTALDSSNALLTAIRSKGPLDDDNDRMIQAHITALSDQTGWGKTRH